MLRTGFCSSLLWDNMLVEKRKNGIHLQTFCLSSHPVYARYEYSGTERFFPRNSSY
jgi:hypothetical protein